MNHFRSQIVFQRALWLRYYLQIILMLMRGLQLLLSFCPVFNCIPLDFYSLFQLIYLVSFSLLVMLLKPLKLKLLLLYLRNNTTVVIFTYWSALWNAPQSSCMIVIKSFYGCINKAATITSSSSSSL